MAQDWSHWKPWAILRKNSATGDYNRLVAFFLSRELCEEYISMKKERHFFDTGSMDDAENEWGMQNFLIDYSMLMDRKSIANNFEIKFGDWCHG